MRYAEVIGDPIAQSKSPLIHKFWLEQSGLSGDYQRTRVPREELAGYFRDRRSDPDWRGCNVTIPHKENVLVHLDELEPRAAAIGAVNCVVRSARGLVGYNTDVDGIAEALNDLVLEGRKAAVIGGGGAARAAVAYLAGRNVRHIAILVRDPKKVEPLRSLAVGSSCEIGSLESAETMFDGAAVIINASPLGMEGCAEMPADLLAAASRQAAVATLFDMVYKTVATPFLAGGQQAGARTVDGLTMLVGQARKAFELFFGEPPPHVDAALRDLLTTEAGNSPGEGHNPGQNR
jgi:shikimate dehydrogenase